ncbi:hypothetical protein AXG93_3217s1120 [Marchantia polymorpha subsp. ruderalis]|uniref:Uncharacterized protein n=1 Tax=Marchantia polymorpha subsp. ruderalis TaxID=1480154 RepID=A0A176VYX4_MARPO|nr:hypothetical protein AXG93_3217s1120 [Marchantia polymorpha subsp. ruderalis]
MVAVHVDSTPRQGNARQEAKILLHTEVSTDRESSDSRLVRGWRSSSELRRLPTAPSRDYYCRKVDAARVEKCRGTGRDGMRWEQRRGCCTHSSSGGGGEDALTQGPTSYVSCVLAQLAEFA